MNNLLTRKELIAGLRLPTLKTAGEYSEDAANLIEVDAYHIETVEAENERLRGAISDIKEAWDWWNVDTYDRCASVVDDAIRAALGEKQ